MVVCSGLPGYQRQEVLGSQRSRLEIVGRGNLTVEPEVLQSGFGVNF